ncbi:MAG: viscotoxin-A3 [Eggerthellaceae bacterium]|nr:viscotoxin-A3 [Eggerthellaceae bacterium]
MSKQEKSPRQLSQEQIMEGLPPVNIGALFMPPVWGAANGIWLAILYYPAWLLADNLFYSVYLDPRPLTVGLSIVAALVLAFATIVFARAGQGYACQRALSMGKTKEQYLKSQKKWAVAMVLVAVIMIVAATYYNLVIRPTVGA